MAKYTKVWWWPYVSEIELSTRCFTNCPFLEHKIKFNHVFSWRLYIDIFIIRHEFIEWHDQDYFNQDLILIQVGQFGTLKWQSWQLVHIGTATIISFLSFSILKRSWLECLFVGTFGFVWIWPGYLFYWALKITFNLLLFIYNSQRDSYNQLPKKLEVLLCYWTDWKGPSVGLGGSLRYFALTIAYSSGTT